MIAKAYLAHDYCHLWNRLNLAQDDKNYQLLAKLQMKI